MRSGPQGSSDILDNSDEALLKPKKNLLQFEKIFA